MLLVDEESIDLFEYRYLLKVLPVIDEFLGYREQLDSKLGTLGVAEREGEPPALQNPTDGRIGNLF